MMQNVYSYYNYSFVQNNTYKWFYWFIYAMENSSLKLRHDLTWPYMMVRLSEIMRILSIVNEAWFCMTSHNDKSIQDHEKLMTISKVM